MSVPEGSPLNGVPGYGVCVWLRIGEVARRTGLTVRTLRHYDDLGLLVPGERTSGDYRLYGSDDLDRLLAIQSLKSLGLSLEEIGSALDDPDFDADEVLTRHVALVEERLAAERDLLTRLRALQSAARTGWEDVVAVIELTERLRHPDPGVRLRAVITSGGLAPLASLLDGLRTDPEPGVREALTWSVVQYGADAVGPVVSLLDDPDPDVRRQMAHVLSKFRDPAGVVPLAAHLDDADPAVRAKVAFALGQIGGAEATASLITALGDDDPVLADAVTSALTRAGGAVVGPLGAIATTSHLPAARRQAVEVLGAVGDDAATPLLVAALADEDAGVRFEALWALGSLDNDEAGRAVGGAQNSSDEHVRLLARRLQAARQDRSGHEG